MPISPIKSPDWSSVTRRGMQEMLTFLDDHNSDNPTLIETEQGWRRLIGAGFGYSYEYRKEIAEGGWVFYNLGNGLRLITVDMVANSVIPRRHSPQDHLVLSAVFNANVALLDNQERVGQLSDGFCTIYGMPAGYEFKSIYQPGNKLQWVSLFLDRKEFYNILGIEREDTTDAVQRFIENGEVFSPTNVMLSPNAYLTAQQLLECPFSGGYRKAFLRSKSQELACHILFSMCSEESAGAMPEASLLSEEDIRKVHRALRYLKHDFGEPANIPELAYAVGLTRRKLQFGFKLLFGNTVAKVRDTLRMEHALKLVCTSNMPITQIALETGYEHPASFTRAFKAAYGVSPADRRHQGRTLNGFSY